MVKDQVVRNLASGAGHRPAEDWQHGAVHVPGHAPIARSQPAEPHHL